MKIIAVVGANNHNCIYINLDMINVVYQIPNNNSYYMIVMNNGIEYQIAESELAKLF